MKYSIKLFGIFEDEIGQSVLEIEAESVLKVGELREKLHQNYPILEEVQHYMVAVNQIYCNDFNALLTEKDEIALIPPIAGG